MISIGFSCLSFRRIVLILKVGAIESASAVGGRH